MQIPMPKLRPLLVHNRIFFLGPGVNSIAESGISYADGMQVQFSPDLQIEPYTTYWAGSGRSLVSMGSFSYTLSTLPSSVSVGRYSSIALGLRVMGAKHPLEWASTSPVFYNRQLMMRTYEGDLAEQPRYQKFEYQAGNITIGNDVWIGENVTLGHGVSVGDGAVIASNAVVTKDVAPYTVVGGVPAKVIRSRFDDETVRLLLEAQWWRYSPSSLRDVDVRHPHEFAANVIELAKTGDIEEYSPSFLDGRELEEAARS
ncbi:MULTISPECIES: CatB-related O-acetyltransferase [unclassified Arthrobacter]|uniref:CatB-related O-acetyltransferase n=2 Tax=Arthrobacter TaxID=1663 RepID=UPI0022B088A8|nr:MULTISPECIES: CatB-related O-acetyltransferase [unclassified Arthrobacter]MDK1279074.1 CatB-related O-acetyltransferase [Arthrobacter sp. zg.Y820]